MTAKRKGAIEQAVDVARLWVFPDHGYKPLEEKDLPQMVREIVGTYLSALGEGLTLGELK